VSQLSIEIYRNVITGPFQGNQTTFVEGPAGAGKTTLAIERLLYLLRQGVPARRIGVLVPQRTLGLAYAEALDRLSDTGDVLVDIVTVGGLARRSVELFWPLIARPAGFAQPTRPPTFLTLETAQYYMNSIVGPVLDARGFEGITVQRNRLVSQLIDNLNKSAVVGFPPEEIGARLKAAWAGERTQARIFDQTEACALAFRSYCLEHNLLDFSLQLEVFVRRLLPLRAFREYLFGKYRHLIVDNVEEDTPVAHDLLRAWLPNCESAWVLFDDEGGHRIFLGADPEGGHALKDACRTVLSLTSSWVMSPEVDALQTGVAYILCGRTDAVTREMRGARAALKPMNADYQPQMLEQVVLEVRRLVQEQGVAPAEIVILAPFLNDTLRFTLGEQFNRCGVRFRSHRPSRALRDEPATHCLLTLAALAHPHWRLPPTEADVVQALIQAIEGLDLVRSQFLARIVYRIRDGQPVLSSFEQIGADAQDRLTYSLGERYEELRQWLASYQARGVWAELDHFFSLLFGEILSQPDFGFHRNFDAAAQAANLIESIRKFRQVVDLSDLPTGRSVGQEYVAMVQQGVVAAQYVQRWEVPDDEAVLLAPAYTFLMYNRPVDYQFWLNAGSPGWWERIYQPITHPFVLSRHWPADRVWTDADEFAARQTVLCRLTVGLLRRCRRGVYLGISTLSEQGYEEGGPLLQALNRLLRQLQRLDEPDARTTRPSRAAPVSGNGGGS
jgi:hypothetical protein